MSLTVARELALEIAERIDTLPRLTVSRFFSGAGLAADGVQFGFVKKGSLYLRVDDENCAAFEALAAKPFAYAGRSKTVTVASYYEAPREIVDDPDVLGRWAAEAHRAALAAQHREKSGKPERKARSAAESNHCQGDPIPPSGPPVSCNASASRASPRLKGRPDDRIWA